MKSTDGPLAALGWNDFFSEQVSVAEAQQYRPVRVLAVHRGKIDVAGEGVQLSITPYIPGALPSDEVLSVGCELVSRRWSSVFEVRV